LNNSLKCFGDGTFIDSFNGAWSQPSVLDRTLPLIDTTNSQPNTSIYSFGVKILLEHYHHDIRSQLGLIGQRDQPNLHHLVSTYQRYKFGRANSLNICLLLPLSSAYSFFVVSQESKTCCLVVIFIVLVVGCLMGTRHHVGHWIRSECWSRNTAMQVEYH